MHYVENQMVDNPEPDGEATEPMSGRKLYAPGVIAAYTVLANFPVGLVLYGLNLRARSQHRLGVLMLLFGGVSSVLLVVLAMGDSLPPYGIVIGWLAAAYLFKLEKRPFERAVSEGASRARWWTPALWLLAVVILLFLFENFATR